MPLDIPHHTFQNHSMADHSIESRRAYDKTAKIWPPPGLQFDVAKMTRSAVSKVKQFQERRRASRNSNNIPTTSENKTSDQSSAKAFEFGIPDPQSQSLLFKLPVSIRQRIYMYALGSGTSNIHILSVSSLSKQNQQQPPPLLASSSSPASSSNSPSSTRTPRHLRCKCASCPGRAYHLEPPYMWRRLRSCETGKYDAEAIGNYISIDVLFTCRRIYLEAVQYLYVGNVFSFAGPLQMGRFFGDDSITNDSVGVSTAANVSIGRNKQFGNGMVPRRCLEEGWIRRLHVDLDVLSPAPKWISKDGQMGGLSKENEEKRRHAENRYDAAWECLLRLPGLCEFELRIYAPESPPVPGGESGSHTGTSVIRTPASWSRDIMALAPIRQKETVVSATFFVPDELMAGVPEWIQETASSPCKVVRLKEWEWMRGVEEQGTSPFASFYSPVSY